MGTNNEKRNVIRDIIIGLCIIILLVITIYRWVKFGFGAEEAQGTFWCAMGFSALQAYFSGGKKVFLGFSLALFVWGIRCMIIGIL